MRLKYRLYLAYIVSIDTFKYGPAPLEVSVVEVVKERYSKFDFALV
ncbi:MAG: hypothetical protein ACI9VM_000874 [Candidatus Azotimanducaceae bacterium]